MKADVNCSNCGAEYEREGVEVPEDIADSGFYIVVHDCEKCRGKP